MKLLNLDTSTDINSFLVVVMYREAVQVEFAVL